MALHLVDRTAGRMVGRSAVMTAWWSAENWVEWRAAQLAGRVAAGMAALRGLQ